MSKYTNTKLGAEMSAPEKIWIAGPLEECGNYYAEAVEAEGEHGGYAVEYTLHRREQ